MQRLDLREIVKRYGSVTALAGVDLEVDPGESLVILGPSGSGKSTLLRVIAGLVTPDEGVVVFDSERQNEVPAHKRGVSLVFQNFALYPHLSAERNITLGLRHGLGLTRDQAAERVARVADLLDITELLGRRPAQMSGGQQQRVALARALAREAGIVLLDEPLSGLDAQLKQRLRVEITELLRSVGTTSIHVTHDQDDAMAMGDRIAVMRAGVIEQHGTPQEIYERPATTFVAGFVGTPPMNLLNAEMVDGRLRGPLRDPVSGSNERSGSSGSVKVRDGRVVVGVRPEQFRSDIDDGWGVQGTVVSTLLSQGNWTVTLRLEDETTVQGTVPLTDQPSHGEQLSLQVAERDLHLFDADSGRRLAVRNDASPHPA